MGIKYKKVSLCIQGRLHDQDHSEASQLAQTASKLHYGSETSDLAYPEAIKERVSQNVINKETYEDSMAYSTMLFGYYKTKLGWGSSSYSWSSACGQIQGPEFDSPEAL